ncbi:MAG TPA: HD domain-containing protein [Candidatus Faecimonas gallistercoris]|nr:HD domain-containing protein [Candidatus Faecimonas gallistercoris]
MRKLDIIKKNFLKIEDTYSSFATKSSQAIRFGEIDEDIRAPFFRDVDRIIHALSYARYADKTQVYSFKENDHISERMLHVQLVSKVARTIGRALNLNCDLIEAIALGHDVGHTPLGHVGESLLNEISLRELGEYFAHNIQGVRHYMEVENHGEGLNLTLQVLDGIMCHNGEMLSNIYVPVKKTKDEFLIQYKNAYHDLKTSSHNHPMTLEGCVVRISDIIGYIGRDIEDAIELGKFQRDELPASITNILGNTNSQIMNTVILDIIENSLSKPYIAMSEEVYHALFRLKKFNGEHIYSKSVTKKDVAYYREGMNKLYHTYLNDINQHNLSSIIYTIFLDFQSSRYLNSTSDKRKVIDFIAGMTDDMFFREVKKVMTP